MIPGGDTQVLDDLDPAADHHRTAIYGETQPLDDLGDWAKTQVLDDDEADRTVALSDGDNDEDLLDDGTSPPKEKRDAPAAVDSDASTDDEGGAIGEHVSSVLALSGDSLKSTPGSVRRSFAAVRAASLRSSGLAAARTITPNMDTESEPCFVNVEFNRKEAKTIDGQDDVEAIEMDRQLNSVKHPASLSTKSSEMDLVHKTEKTLNDDYNRDETKSRNKNPRVKKLFNEVIPGMEEFTTNTKSINGEVDSSCMFVTDYAVAGLSYVTSQEPGELSQANALDVVDKFLSVNDAGLSQKAETGNTDMVKSPSTVKASGVQSLAKRMEQRSPVGKPGTFEWIDGLEDEGGGDFFSKRKDTLFDSKGGPRKSHSHPPKARHFSAGMTRGARDNSGKQKHGNPSNHLKMNIVHSDSRLELHNSELSEKVHISERKAKKILFQDMNEQSNLKSPGQQLEANDVDGNDGFYDIGPNTQMAAEAMEALGQGSPYKPRDDAHVVSENMPENSTMSASVKNTCAINTSLLKRTFSTFDSDGVTTRSKRRDTLHSQMGKGVLSLSRSRTSSARVKKSSEDTAEYTTVKKKKSRRGHVNARHSVNGNEYSKSLKSEKSRRTMNDNSMKKVERYRSSLRSNCQLSPSKEPVHGEFHVSNAPIAHRTRHSKTLKLLQATEALSSDGKHTNGVIGGNSLMATERQEKVHADGCRTLKAKRKGSNIGQQIATSDGNTTCAELQTTEVHTEKEHKSTSPMKVICSHPKRRRTCQMISGNQETNANLNNPFVLLAGIVATDQLPVRQNDKIIKSVPEILDTAMRKKRSVSRNMPFQMEGMPLKTRNMPIESDVRAGSSCKPFAEKDSKVCWDGPILHEAGSSDTGDSCSTAVIEDRQRLGEVAVPMQGEGSTNHVEDAGKEDRSPKSKVYTSALTCKTPSKEVNAVSPICMAEEPLTLSNRGLSRSAVVRELIRLEASKAAPTRILKDLRRRKDMASVRVLFSRHLDEDITKQQKKILGRLGVPTASSMLDATHFITDKFVRTRNMLEAIALGKPVVTHLWLESCGQASCFIDEKNYILRDLKKEKEIGFSMPVSLARASQCPLLQGKRVFITPNVKPDCGLIANLVKAAQGQPMERIGRSAMKDDKVPDDLLILSCEEDYPICKPLLEKGAEIFSSELVLNGIVIQKLEYERHRLFVDRVRQTRSTIWLRREDSHRILPVTKCT